MMDDSIITMIVARLARLVAQRKRIPLSAAFCYIYASPFYVQMKNKDAKWWYLDIETLYHHLESVHKSSITPVDAQIVFLSFCVNNYAVIHKLSELQTLALFMRYGVDEYLINGFDMIHTQGWEYINKDIEEYIRTHK